MRATFQKESVSEELALEMLEAAIGKARELGKAFAIAVVDESGVLKSFIRMDGAPLISVQVAIDKAYTAAGYGLPTHRWYELLMEDRPLAMGAHAINRLIVFGGGYPISVGGRIVGGVGVSGGNAEEDMKVAEAALEVLDKSDTSRGDRERAQEHT
ncbi:hypothetical protein NAS2_0778 [Conexivisphaera calida]|uniref:Cobalamin adenosyltransferase n=1 Tax=Conexivisphaera calida TaxID=1874277 RepID=A0A4P2VDL4_9ARCH|nr:heme-binding protein [Conexivisphaera calida]BBE42167.1 hypothetical protein NAS2_0778 [Conexivisphaera calida]